jgi:hypothetical protein
MALPKKKKWPKGLKARLNKKLAGDKRIAENKAIEKAIEAARKKLGR